MEFPRLGPEYRKVNEDESTYTHEQVENIKAALANPKVRKEVEEIASQKFNHEEFAQIYKYLEQGDTAGEILFNKLMIVIHEKLRWFSAFRTMDDRPMRQEGRSSKKPSLDYYDNKRDVSSGGEDVPYKGRYGKYSDDNSES